MELSQESIKGELCERSTEIVGDDDEGKEERATDVVEDEDDEGTRQPYNCSFCRRGFPTAQALGGHMNVHRKDRPGRGGAAPAPARTTSNVVVFDTLPASSSSSKFTASPELAERPPQELRLFGRGKEGGGAPESDQRRELICSKKNGDGDHRGDNGEDEELDLELRLGGS